MNTLLLIVACWLTVNSLLAAFVACGLHRGVEAPARPPRPAFELSVADVAEELGVAFRHAAGRVADK